MSSDRIVALEQRLVTLERRRRVSTGLTLLSLVLLVASQAAVPHAQPSTETKFKAPFKIINNRGETIFSVETLGAETKVSIVDENVAIAGINAGKDGSAFYLTGKGGVARIGMDFDGPGTGPSILMKDPGGDVLTVSSDAVSINAPLKVRPGDSPDKDTVEVHGTLSVRDSKGRRGATIGATGVRVHAADGVSVAASLGVDEAGKGKLVVGLPTGPRGVLGQPSAGGISFALYDAPGTAFRIGMFAAPSGTSYVRLYGGKRYGELNVTPGSSVVNLFNDAGYPAASLAATTNGFGQLELGNAAGDVTVQAGTTSSGLGVVRAGPVMGGVVGFEGSLPWAILGKKGK